MTVLPRTTIALAGALAMSCASTGPVFDPSTKIAIVETTPSRGSKIQADTLLRVVADYSLEKFQPGKDRIVVVFKTRGGGTWEQSRHVLSKAEGRVTFELAGAELIKQAELVRPLRMLLVVDRFLSPTEVRTLSGTQAVHFEAESAESPVRNARLLPPAVGKGQLISDMVRDPRYRPKLPPELNRDGMVVWGLFKLCVDDEGGVYEVTVLKSADRMVDNDWVAIMRTLKHRPYKIGGQPVPYCYPLRLEVRSVAEPPRPPL